MPTDPYRISFSYTSLVRVPPANGVKFSDWRATSRLPGSNEILNANSVEVNGLPSGQFAFVICHCGEHAPRSHPGALASFISMRDTETAHWIHASDYTDLQKKIAEDYDNRSPLIDALLEGV